MNNIKTLRNTTLVPISIPDAGLVTIQVGETFIIPVEKYLVWAASLDIIIPVTNGAIIVSNGTIDLGSVNGLNYLRYPHEASSIGFSAFSFTSKDVLSAIVEAKNAAITVLNSPQIMQVGDDKGFNNKWLKTIGGARGDEGPIPLRNPSVLKGITFTNSKIASGDLQIYKNDILFFSQILISRRTFYKTNGLTAVTGLQGDRIGVLANTTNPAETGANIFIELYWEATSIVFGEGGT